MREKNTIKIKMSQIPDCTLVSACFCVHKNNPNSLSLEEIVKRSDTVLRIPVYLVLYGDCETLSIMREKRMEYGYDDITQYIETDLDDLWTYQYKETVIQNRAKYWPTADPRAQTDSHLITCNKFDFVLKVLERDPFKTSKLGWIDCFLHENGKKICEDYSPDILVDILNRVDERYHFQILNVNDKKYIAKEHQQEFYLQYRWVMCGCFFTCGKEIGRKVLNRLKEIFVETTLQGFGHSEEMLYLGIFEEFTEDEIERSYGDYGQILNNFLAPTKNLHYIYWFILKNYMRHQYYKEAFKCAGVLLEQIHAGKIAYSYELWLNILMDSYLAAYFVKPTACKSIAAHIHHVRFTNAEMQQEYLKHESHYDFTLQLHE